MSSEQYMMCPNDEKEEDQQHIIETKLRGATASEDGSIQGRFVLDESAEARIQGCWVRQYDVRSL
jgi:hypothetical protein